MLTVCVLATLAASVAEKPLRLAAPGLKSVGISPQLGEFYSEHLAQQLALLGLRVTTSAQIAAVLGAERQRQLLSCSDSGSCIAELAAGLGVDGILVGSIGRVGRSHQLNVSVVSPLDGRSLALHSESVDSEDQVLGALTRAARALTATLRNDSVPAPAVAASTLVEPPRRWRWAWAPALAGLALAGAGAVFLALSRDRYDGLMGPGAAGISQLTYEQALSAASTGQTFQVVGAAMLGVGLAAGCAFAVLWFLR